MSQKSDYAGFRLPFSTKQEKILEVSVEFVYT